MTRKKTLWTLAAAVALLALLTTSIIVYFVDQHKTLYHFLAVDPGKLYRGGTLSDRGLKMVKDRIGLKTIINLRAEDENRQPWHEREKRFCAANGIELVDIPLAFETPPTDAQLAQYLKIVTDPAKLPVMIHCEMGVIRTGMMVVLYNVAVQKQSNQEAFAKLPMFGHTLDDKAPAVKQFMLNCKAPTNKPL